ASHHKAIAPLQSTYTATGSYVHVVDPVSREIRSTPNSFSPLRITAIHDHIAFIKQRPEFYQHGVDDRGRQHQPQHTRSRQSLKKVLERIAGLGTHAGQAYARFGIHI